MKDLYLDAVFKGTAEYGRQNPAVVSITTRTRVRSWNQREQDLFKLFGVTPPRPGERVQRAVASGFILNTAGDILTNNHVVEGDRKSVV